METKEKNVLASIIMEAKREKENFINKLSDYLDGNVSTVDISSGKSAKVAEEGEDIHHHHHHHHNEECGCGDDCKCNMHHHSMCGCAEGIKAELEKIVVAIDNLTSTLQAIDIKISRDMSQQKDL